MRPDLTRLVALAERGRQLRAERPPAATSSLRVTATKDGRTAVHVYGYIGDSWWDDSVTAAGFAKELAGIGNGGIDLHINSGGGSVFDAIAMHAALLNHPSDVVTRVDGIAASAASFLAMAGDEIVVEKPAKMMIHDASGITVGNAADMRQMADVLDEISDTIAGMYADRAGGTVTVWRDAMRAETWYSAAQAVEVGLADRVANDKSATQSQSTEGDKSGTDSATGTPEDRRAQLIRARARVRVALGG